MLLTLNPDLSGRIEEISISWEQCRSEKIMDKGGGVLNIKFGNPLRSKLIDASFGNAGQLQTLVLRALDDLEIKEASPEPLLTLCRRSR